MKTKFIRSAPLWIALVAALLILWGGQTLSGEQGHDKLLQYLPGFILLCAMFLVGYLHERSSGKRWRMKPLSYRLLAGSLIALYLLCGMMSGVWLRNVFPHYVEAAYTTFYWAAAGAALIIALGTSVLVPDIARKRFVRASTVALLILVGIASGPIIWGWGPGPTTNTPTTTIAVAIWAMPFLYIAGVFSRMSHRTPQAK